MICVPPEICHPFVNRCVKALPDRSCGACRRNWRQKCAADRSWQDRSWPDARIDRAGQMKYQGQFVLRIQLDSGPREFLERSGSHVESVNAWQQSGDIEVAGIIGFSGYCKFFAGSVTVTVALGTDAPCWSTMRPDMEPVMFCVYAPPTSTARARNINADTLRILKAPFIALPRSAPQSRFNYRQRGSRNRPCNRNRAQLSPSVINGYSQRS